MPSYVALLRGINVGGRNPVAMQALAACFLDAGYANVRTHLQSGNVLFDAALSDAAALETALDDLLAAAFEVAIPTVVRSRDELADTIASAPADHGSPDLRSDVFFLKRPLTVEAAMGQVPELREGVDSIAPGPGALYFSRVEDRATKTRITKFMSMPVFQQMTVRTWRTTTRLLQMLDE
ncbi:DUF1697 domain-containing protein [Nocardioides sp. NPDC057577]|uniref:DUF1697 domain-containing protein n=1 Tax=Nocardioides sp. NPDC057577 TaxID=3346171 RepID=UPI00366A8C55